MNSDGDLLRRFAETHDEACFAEIVQRHIPFVYAVSLRRLRDAHAASDATQAVFVALARKARAVANAPSVTGWLHRSACFETRNLMRAQANRLTRETEAHRLGTATAEIRPDLAAMETVLDEVLCELSARDREAILARYFSGRSYAEIGMTLGLTENTARMRVERALGRLRDRLQRRGITSTAAALAGALPAHASANVPNGLLAMVTKVSVMGLAGTGAALFTFMSTAKLITGIVVAAAIGGFVYEHRLTSRLETDLATARAESGAANTQLRAIQREIAELKTRPASQAPAPAAPVQSDPATVAAPPSQVVAAIPGVTPKAPKGWFKNGSANDLYEVGVDENNAWGGMPSAYAKSIGAADKKFGGMMQTISADTYKDQRVRLTGWVKTEDANDGGGHLWMRVDGPVANKSLQFDNMDGRAPKGTTDWQEYSVVLDVPPEATRLNYGFFVSGNGKIWVNGLTITPVGNDVPSTNLIKPPPALPATPVNLGFTPPPSSG